MVKTLRKNRSPRVIDAHCSPSRRDPAGYSRLMGADGEGTHARLRAHFRELYGPKIPEHSGRVTERNASSISSSSIARRSVTGITNLDLP